MASEAEIDLIVNASNTLPQITRDLTRIVNTAEEGADTIDLDVAIATQESLSTVARDLDRLIAAADAGAPDIDLDAVLDQTRAISEVQESLGRVIAAAQASADADPIDIQAVLNSSQSLVRVRGELDRVVAAAQRTADDIDIDADVDTEEANRSLLRFLPTLNRTAAGANNTSRAMRQFKLAVIGTAPALGTVTPLLAGLVTSLENVLPASAVATQGMLAMQLVSGTLKLGMLGLEEAIEAAFDPDATPQELAEALEKLAPSARDFVTELQSMKDEFNGLRLNVQDALFQDLDQSLRDLSRSALPQVGAALERTAVTLNQAGRAAADAAGELAANGTLGRALDGATTGLQNLVNIPAQATTAFGQLAAAAAPAFDRITKAVAETATRISEDLSGAFESGALEDAINNSIDVIAQLGRVAGNVFGILGNLIEGVSTSGNGLFGTLERITQGLEDVTASKEFQDTLGELIETMNTLGREAAPLFVQALSSISQVIQILAPVARDLIEVLGDNLGQILEAAEEPLNQLADTFGKAVVAILPFVDLAGDLVTEILPILTPLFETLGRVIEDMTPFLKQLAENLGAQLLPILERMPEVLEKILPVFERLSAEVFPVLTDTLEELAPHLEDLATQFGDLAVELAPVVADFLEFSAIIASNLIPIIGPALTSLIIALTETLKFLSDVIETFILPALRTLGNVLTGDLSGALTSAGLSTTQFTDLASSAYQKLLGNALSSIGKLVTGVRDGAQRAALALVDATQKGISAALRLLTSLPSQARSAVGNLGSVLFDAGASLINGLINGITSKIGQIRDTLSSVTSLIPDWKGPMDVDKKLLTPSGRAIMDGLIDGFQDRVPDVQMALGNITSLIPQSIAAPGLASVGAPVVFVTIGNEAVDQFVTTRVRQENLIQTRTFAQGVRR